MKLLKEMSDDLREMVDVARKFTLEEIIPVAAEHDRTGEVSVGPGGGAGGIHCSSTH